MSLENLETTTSAEALVEAGIIDAAKIIENDIQEGGEVSPNAAEEAVKKLEDVIIASGHGSILNMVKENQEIFEVANSLLFRAVGLSANTNEDVFLIQTNNGVLFLTETEYTQTLETAEPHIKAQISEHFPEADAKVLSEKYDEYVAGATLKHIDTNVAKQYIETIQAQRAASAGIEASGTEAE